MAQAILVAMIAGLASALLSGILTPNAAPMAMLFLIAPLPLFIAGLAWHPLVAALGGLIGGIVASMLISDRAAIALVGSIAIPVFSMCALALRAFGPASPYRQDNRALAAEGLDLGRIALGVALYTALIVVTSVMLVEPDHAAFVTRLQLQSERVLTQMLGAHANPNMPVAMLAEMMSSLLLPISGLVVLVTLTLSATLALQISHRGGRLLFAKPDLRRFRLPGGALILLALALIMATRDGFPGVFGEIVALGMVFLLMLQGVAVLHVRTIGMAGRGALVGLAWALIVILGAPALLFAALGIADHLFDLRRGKP